MGIKTFDQEQILAKRNILTEILVENCLLDKRLWVHKIIGSEKCWFKRRFGFKKDFQKMVLEKIRCQKRNWAKKIFSVQKKFGS